MLSTAAPLRRGEILPFALPRGAGRSGRPTGAIADGPSAPTKAAASCRASAARSGSTQSFSPVPTFLQERLQRRGLEGGPEGPTTKKRGGIPPQRGRTSPCRTSRESFPCCSSSESSPTGSKRATGRPRSTISAGRPLVRLSIGALGLFLASVRLAVLIRKEWTGGKSNFRCRHGWKRDAQALAFRLPPHERDERGGRIPSARAIRVQPDRIRPGRLHF